MKEAKAKANENIHAKHVNLTEADIAIERLHSNPYNGEFYATSYSELGLPEDIVSGDISRANIITVDMYMQGALEVLIVSSIGGMANLVLTRPVHSLENGNRLLPSGTKLVCNYEPLTAYGQTRLPVTCTRAILPNGRSILLSDVTLYDTMGRSGLVGHVDNRIFEKYGESFLTSVIASVGIGAASTATEGTVAGDIVAYSGVNMLDKSLEMLDEYLDLAPIITIPAGARVIARTAVDINVNSTKAKMLVL